MMNKLILAAAALFSCSAALADDPVVTDGDKYVVKFEN